MNANPTSGPMKKRKIHHARAASSSRHSLRTSARSQRLREGKEHLFEIAGAGRGRELVARAFAADPARAQEDEAIADARRVRELMNREHERPASGRDLAEHGRDLAALPQVEAVER